MFSFGDSNVWEDMGTGVVSKDYIEITRGEVLTITVRSEYDNSIIIQSRVLPERPYKMQEGTMIIWTENDSCDLALSFQEKTACDELWMKICEVQGHLSEDGDQSDRFDDSWSLPELPPCELGKLDEILNLVVSVAPFPHRRVTLALSIEQEQYISKLLEIFQICEDLENLDGLHHLYEIFKSLLMFNSASLLQIMFQDDLMMDVIGCMEYNPNKTTPGGHREYLAKRSEFRDVIEFSNPDLLSKIHQTYKVQYIQEVILPTPSLFEENMMCALNSIVLFNKAEIVNAIQLDHHFLKQLFDELCLESTLDTKYQQLVALLKEICIFSQALENADRTKLFLKLNSYGFMSAVEGMLMYEDVVVVSTAVDVLNLIADFNASFLREHSLDTKETTNEDTQFMNIIISLLVDGEFTDLDVQLVNLIKALVNPENMTAEVANQTMEKVNFLRYFYNNCIPRLLAPLMAQTSSDKISKDTSQNAVILSNILDILSLCVRVHTYHIRNFVIDKNVLSRVLVLMMSSHGHLVLAALRFCRRIVGLKDDFYNRYLVYRNLLSPIVKAFMANGHRYNLVDSAILELFDFIRLENKSLLSYVVENFWSTLETVDYVDTFKNLKLKHEQEKEAKEAHSIPTVGNVVVQTRYKRDPRQMDEDEEAWFDEEEVEFIPFNASTAVTTPTTTPAAPPHSNTTMPLSTIATPHSTVATPMSVLDSVFTTSLGSAGPPGSYSPRPITVGSKLQQMVADGKVSPMPMISAALQSLVDYDEDSDEETSDPAEPEVGMATETSDPVNEEEVCVAAETSTSDPAEQEVGVAAETLLSDPANEEVGGAVEPAKQEVDRGEAEGGRLNPAKRQKLS